MPLPYCSDYPEKIFSEVGWHDIFVDYVGSETASYGRIKTFKQDIKEKRHPMNSYFVIGRKDN